MKRMVQLQERRGAKLADMRKIQTVADDANRDLSDNERQAFDAAEAEVRSLNTQIERAARLENLERSAEGQPLNDNTPDFAREVRSFSLLRAIASTFDPNVDAGREREVSQELAKRMQKQSPESIIVPFAAMFGPSSEKRVVTTPSAGAGALGTDLRSDLLIENLKTRAVVGQAGATFLTGLRQNISIPAVDGGATTAWFATESGGSLSAADLDINSRALTPKTVGCMTEFSRGMVVQATPDVEALARSDFSRALASALDAAALVGAVNGPTGIIAAKYTAGAMGSWATPTYAQGLALAEAPEIANADGVNWAWVLHPAVRKKLRGTVRVSSTDSVMIMEGANTLLDRPAFVSAHAQMLGSPSGGAGIFGAWEHLLVGIFGEGVEILTNPYHPDSYARGGVAVRGLLSADVAIRHLEAFATFDDMSTT